MPGLPFFEDSGETGYRALRLQINIGDGDDGGGFGGLAGDATDLLGLPSPPSFPSWADHLLSLSLHLGLAPEVDYADLLISDPMGTLEAAVGEPGSIAIGEPDNPENLFTGKLVAIEQRSNGQRLYRLANGSHALARARINQSLVDMTVQDAIGFAAGLAEYSPAAQVGGSDAVLPQIVFDDSRSLWEHMARIGALRGIDLWFDADDQLQIADGLEQGETVAAYRWGKDLLEYNLWQRVPHSGAVTVFGAGRVDNGFKLRKQAAPNRAETGEGATPRFYREGLLQTQQDLSGRAAAAARQGQRRSSAGEVVVSGSAALGPGRLVELSELPGGGDGVYLITRVHHSFDGEHGWRNRLSVSAAGDASGLPGGLGGLI